MPFFLARPTANATATSITKPVPTLTKPTGDGVFDLGGRQEGSISAPGLVLMPYGAGAATNTFSMAVYGWRSTLGSGGAYRLWVPALLASFTCTLGTAPGLAGADVNASQLFCDTITLAAGNANISNEILSPTGNEPAHIILDGKGFTLIECRFGTGSSATSCNSLVTRF